MWKIVFKNLAYPSFALRLVVPILIFVYNPIFVAALVILLDWVDGQFWRQQKISWFKYNLIDKSLDTYWYFVSLIYAYINLPLFELLLVLFLFRFAGFALFIIKRDDWPFIIFQNFYENIFVVMLLKIDLFIGLLFAVVLKVIQELYAHMGTYWVMKHFNVPDWMLAPDKI